MKLTNIAADKQPEDHNGSCLERILRKIATAALKRVSVKVLLLLLFAGTTAIFALHCNKVQLTSIMLPGFGLHYKVFYDLLFLDSSQVLVAQTVIDISPSGSYLVDSVQVYAEPFARIYCCGMLFLVFKLAKHFDSCISYTFIPFRHRRSSFIPLMALYSRSIFLVKEWFVDVFA